MVDDIIKSIKSTLYERVSSPLLGTFSVSWVLWNHEYLVVLFSSMDPIKKKAFIDSTFYPNGFQDYAIQYGLYPLLTTIFLLYLLPPLSKKVYEHSRKKLSELIKIKQEIEGMELLSEEDSQNLRAEHSKIRLELGSTIGQLEKQIEVLKKSNEDLYEKNKTMFMEMDGTNKDLETSKNRLETELTELKKGYDTLAKDNTNLRNNKEKDMVQQLEEEIVQKSKKIEEEFRKSQGDRLENEIEKLKQQLSESTQRNKELEAKNVRMLGLSNNIEIQNSNRPILEGSESEKDDAHYMIGYSNSIKKVLDELFNKIFLHNTEATKSSPVIYQIASYLEKGYMGAIDDITKSIQKYSDKAIDKALHLMKEYDVIGERDKRYFITEKGKELSSMHDLYSQLIYLEKNKKKESQEQ